jgi:hypothetical protein
MTFLWLPPICGKNGRTNSPFRFGSCVSFACFSVQRTFPGAVISVLIKCQSYDEVILSSERKNEQQVQGESCHADVLYCDVPVSLSVNLFWLVNLPI